MRALTGSDVYVEDKLFATLDTTVRALRRGASGEVKPRILVSDTVGFIKKLPHDLVASFKSTLDEALEASLLLHVVDASDPSWEAQREVTCDVLAEIGAGDVPRVVVLNKIDLLERVAFAKLRTTFPDAWLVSARDAESVRDLEERIVAFFEAAFEEAELDVPFDKQSVLHQIHEHGRIVKETWSDRGAHVVFRAEPEAIARIRGLLAR
jgi:GTP-binding protein HflX